MKIRTDFVTNSSSSSFVVSKKDTTQDQLERAIQEIIIKTVKTYDNDEWLNSELSAIENWTEEKESYIGDDGSYKISSVSKDEEGYGSYDSFISDDDGEYFMIDNNCRIRYQWDIVKDVLAKHNIEFEYGFCD